MEYFQKNHLPDNNLNGEMFDLPHFDKIEGSDYIKGVYRGIPVELSYVRPFKKSYVEYRDDDGNWRRGMTNVPIFGSVWMICDFNTSLRDGVLVRERRIEEMQSVTSGSPEFEQNFVVKCDNGDSYSPF